MATKKKRRKFTASFKSQVVMEALQREAPQAELARRYDIHPNLIVEWKKSLQANSHRIFADPHPEKDERDKLIEALKKKNSLLTEDVNFLKKKLAPYL